jgi:polysaccharide deacetylase family protein (PEP-CTERM system associated)
LSQELTQAVGGVPAVGTQLTHRTGGRHLLTVAMEDYFQVGAFHQVIERSQWHRFEQRVEAGTRNTLALLDEHGVTATFFVLGCVAELLPELVREVADRGHEVASKGHYHRSIGLMTPEEYREDLSRAREAIEAATGRAVLGYRVADGWFGPADLWALDVLAHEGYEYDSSVGPFFRSCAAEPWRRFPHQHQFGDRWLAEFPISTIGVLGWYLPIAGGNYLRQIPHALMRRAIAYWHRTFSAPLVFYFHTWELDPDQPRFTGASLLQRMRAYRHLERMPELLSHYLERYRVSSIADHLGLAVGARRPCAEPEVLSASIRLPAVSAPTQDERLPVTLLVPCYNEELVLPYLANTLHDLTSRLESRYEMTLLFVDDGSTDASHDSLHRLFGHWPRARIVRHERNLGLAAALATGLDEAATEVVCSIDCDCTYDPMVLESMIPLLDSTTALVVASPYHPMGRVRNVSRWRLVLSRTASWLYRRVVGGGPRTFTSCCRVYRRSVVRGIPVRSGGYLGIAELLARVVLAQAGVREHPATLDARLLGRSKMKLLRTVAGHLRVLAGLGMLRLRTRRPATRPSDRPVVTR